MDLRLLSWNVRGLGNHDKRVAICKDINSYLSDMLVLQETKREIMSDQFVKEIWGKASNQWLALPSWGALCGILMIWNGARVKVLEHEVGAFSISVRCRMVNMLEEWVFTGVYGLVLGSEVDAFSGELDNAKARWDLPWCLSGDFNLIRFLHERLGDIRREVRMFKFGEFIDSWNLIENPLKGVKFTWTTFRESPSLSRLDRFLYCIEWEDLFPQRSQVAGPRTIFDHSPIILESGCMMGGISPFKFEESWFFKLDFMETVEHVWHQPLFSRNASRVFALKLKSLKHRLKHWNKASAGYFKEESKRCVSKIKGF